jgi:CubicO group peptidase (beta-lactamase class C family)
MKHIARGLAVLLACSTFYVTPMTAAAQISRPATAGFSAERLDRIDELMQQRIDAQWFPGAVTLVARNGRIVHLDAQGLMDVESRRPMQTDAVFRIMSMTKPVVAVAVLMMVEEGKMRLNDPVSRFIPELGGLAVSADVGTSPAGRGVTFDVTIRDLLTHTAGFMTRAGVDQPRITIGPNESLADVLPRLRGVSLDFEPGTRWAYSGQFGFDALVRAVEVAAGVPFDQFAAQRIFGPLSMKDTFFFPPEGHPRIATLYASVDGGLETRGEQGFVNGAYFSGGGGLFSTAEDYLKFALMLDNGGELDGARFLGRKTMELMHSAFMPDSLPGRTAGEGYGLGVRVVTDRAARNTLLSNGSFGWSGAFNTHFFIDPEEHVIGIFMTQSAFLPTRQQLRDDFETAVMQALVDDEDTQ